MKYRIYIDETGNSDLGSSENPNHRYLSLTGVIIDIALVDSIIYPQMEALKRKYFGSHPDEPVILHRKEIVNAKPPFECLRQEEIRNNFNCELLQYLRDWEYQVISVCIDKKRHKETYSIWRYDPYHYCMEILLERFVFFLDQKQSVGDVMAESRGRNEDRRLKLSFDLLFRKGTHYVNHDRFQASLTSKKLKVKPKVANISGLQLADLLAHPSRNEILNDNNLLLNGPAPFGQEIIKILKFKYYQKEGRCFGKKFL